MIPVLQLTTNTIEKDIITSKEKTSNYEADFEVEIASLKETKLTPSAKCINQLFIRLGISEKVTQP